MRRVDGMVSVSITRAATPPTIRLSVGSGYYHYSTVKQGCEQSLQDHGVSNVRHLNGRGRKRRILYCSVLRYTVVYCDVL